jgi:polyisoprenoid-binding protein YceI
MRGLTKNVKLNVAFGGMAKDPYGNEKAGFTVSGKINRSEWGLVWNAAIETGGFVVSDDITISCEIQLINAGENDLKMVLDPEINAVGI